MRILVAYASAHGATEGIARRIAEVLDSDGHTVNHESLADLVDLGRPDFIVFGSAIHNG